MWLSRGFIPILNRLGPPEIRPALAEKCDVWEHLDVHDCEGETEHEAVSENQHEAEDHEAETQDESEDNEE